MRRRILFPLHRLLELSGVYALGQLVGRPTTKRFRELFQQNVRIAESNRVLDMGCGIGGYRDMFGGVYCGIDINPQYIETARKLHSGTFEAMDCTELKFAENTFDHVVTIATTHHLSDSQLVQTVKESLRICNADGCLHIIDAILPLSPRDVFKHFYFRCDRGEFPRRREKLVELVGRTGRIIQTQTLTGPLHDTCYLRIGRR